MSRERRHRANQRRSRGTSDTKTAPRTGELLRSNVPGSLQHASGDADEFDAALVRGASGAPAPAPAKEDEDFEWEQPQEQDRNDAEGELTLADSGGSGRGRGGKGRGGGGGRDGRGDGDSGGEGPGLPAGRGPSHPAAPRRPLPGRAVGFLRASWAELQRVQWPDRRETTQATAVVLGFVVVAGLYLGAADWVAQKIINFIL